MSYEKQLWSQQTLPPTEPETPKEQTRAPASAVQAIMGRLGLARATNEPAANEDTLARDLTDPAWAVRVEAIQKLGKIGKQAPLELLLVALHDEQQSVRVAAARALGRNPRPAAIPALLQTLEDNNWVVRVEAARALGRLPDLFPLDPLFHACKDSDPAVRAAALWALGESGKADVFTSIDAALGDEHASVREAAVLALNHLEGKVVVSSLLNAHLDRDPAVRAAAELGLQKHYPEFNGPPPPPSDSFVLWLARTSYHAEMDSSSAFIPAPSTIYRRLVTWPIQKVGQAPAIVRQSLQKVLPNRQPWSQQAQRLAGGLVTALLICCLIVPWFFITTWPGTGSLAYQASTMFTMYRGHHSSVDQLAWSPNNLSIASADVRGNIMIWQASTGLPLSDYAQRGQVLALTWESSDTVLAVYSGTAHILQVYALTIGNNPQKHLLVQKLHLPGIPQVAAWAPNSQVLAFDRGDGSIQLWDIIQNSLLATIQNDSAEYSHLLWSPDGSQLASISTDGRLQVWDAMTGVHVADLPDAQQASIATWTSYQTQPSLLFINALGQVMRWSPDSNPSLVSYLLAEQVYNLTNSHYLTVNSLTTSPDNEQITMSTSDGIVQARDSTTLNLVDVYRGHSAQVNTVQWSFDSHAIASGSEDTTVQVWQEP